MKKKIKQELEQCYSDIREFVEEIEELSEAYESLIDENRKLANQHKFDVVGLQAIIATQEARLERDIEIIEALR